MRGMKKSVICVAMVVLVCTLLMVTVSATTVDFGKSNQLFFTQKGIVSQIPQGNSGNIDIVKTVPKWMLPAKYSIIKPQANAPYFREPASYLSIKPLPTQVSSISSFGGLIIRGSADGDWISLRSNFYNPSGEIYDGRWHIDVGITPAYWENVVLPGSYTIRIAKNMGGQMGVYYDKTVTVVAGQTTVIGCNPDFGYCPFGC